MKYRYIIVLSICCIFLYCCKKTEIGFLSERLFYRTNPFPAIIGRVTTGIAIETDGSTAPLNVTMLAIRDKNGQPADKLIKQYEIPIYKGEVLATDTTLDMLNSKLGKGMYTPFNISPIGGRMEVTPASVYADTGTYVFDLQVSNVKGTEQLNNIGSVRLTPAIDSQIIGPLATTSIPNQEVTFTTQSLFVVTAQRIPGPNKIIIKFVDKNGVKFKPLSGEVFPRISLPTNLRYSFKQFDPYYPEVITDTAFVYDYPPNTPTFPLFTLNNAYVISYRIPAANNDLAVNINPQFGLRLFPLDVPYVNGTWIITNKINFAARK